MWYYKVITAILLFPWSLALLMVAASVRHRGPRTSRVILLPSVPLETPKGMPLGLPEPSPALSTPLEISAPLAL